MSSPPSLADSACPSAPETIKPAELADRLAHSRDAEDQKRLKEELARMTFGE